MNENGLQIHHANYSKTGGLGLHSLAGTTGQKKSQRVLLSLGFLETNRELPIARTSAAGASGVVEVAARSARFHGPGFVDRQFAAVVALAMQGIDGALAFVVAAHGDEAKAARAIGFTVHDQAAIGDGAMLSEKLVEVLLGGLEGKISHVQFHILF